MLLFLVYKTIKKVQILAIVLFPAKGSFVSAYNMNRYTVARAILSEQKLAGSAMSKSHKIDNSVFILFFEISFSG